MRTETLQRRWDLTHQEVEDLRGRLGGYFGHRMWNRYRDHRGRLHMEVASEWEWDRNIVTNEGLDHALSALLDGGTQITTWYVTIVKTNTAAAAGMTYATPSYTEIAASDVDETVRQAWTGGTVSSQSVDNSASPATYGGNASFTAYGSSLVGGGTAPTTIANTAGGGTLYAYSLYAASKAMDASSSIEVTYTFTSADAGT